MLSTHDWMTREEIAEVLGIVPNSVRGKVQKGQIERKVENGKNLYRVAGAEAPQTRTIQREHVPGPPPTPKPAPSKPPAPRPMEEAKKPQTERPPFNPKQVLLDQIASLKLERNIDAIEKGDEIDLATGEISRELAAKISMRQHRQLKEIEDALERLKLGEYGLCEECGEPIPEARLRLFPAARLCVRCQEELDQYEKFRESQGLRGGAWREESTEAGYTKTFEE
ncbi:MAG: TraR/DksA family transcriptional regulator [Desulfomonile tiedjei]|nr:TraR/DksA family transcriptional regulator [Desulfomonile tiedjei]